MNRSIVTWGGLVITVASFAAHSSAATATGKQYAVATVHPLATDAAMAVYREGGNAVDAAVAAALTLGVVDNHNSGIGGGCLILIRRPDGQLIAIDGRETAPSRASRDMFVVDGKVDASLSRTGPLAVGTPGALAAYAAALKDCGAKPLRRLLAPGIEAAERGFPIDRVYARNLRSTASALLMHAGPDDPRLHADGSPLKEGETLVQKDLAESYRAIAAHGPEWFYAGPFAKMTADWMRSNGGLLSEEDFAAYRVKRREPIRTTFKGHTVVGFPPPSSGGIHIAQLARILDRFDLKSLNETDRATAIHVIAEAMKLVFADRAYWLGDADFADVPRGLIDDDYLAGLAAKISVDRATPVLKHGTPNGWRQDLFGRHTTHIAAADASGYWVAITATVNTSFGSKVVIPGTGIIMNNEMDDFSARPGVANAFGLVGAENNAIAPGKRPLSSMSPTIVLGPDNEPVLTVGAAGGPKIITQAALVVLRTLAMGKDLPDAVAGPRFHHQWRPDVLSLEASQPTSLRGALEAKGHEVVTLPTAGVTQAIGLDANGRFVAVSDPRVPSKAAAE